MGRNVVNLLNFSCKLQKLTLFKGVNWKEVKHLRELTANLSKQAMERTGTQAVSEISWEVSDTRLGHEKASGC